ncbi:MAG: hypothetical protein HOV81_31340 [Kofleriaceae bacterium]|nr:hypothetical protein [Kofleriaceae bacterium]
MVTEHALREATEHFTTYHLAGLKGHVLERTERVTGRLFASVTFMS